MANEHATAQRRADVRGPIRVTLPAAIAYDPEALKQSLGDVLGQIGCRACCSGFDVLLREELRTIVVNDELEAVKLGASL